MRLLDILARLDTCELRHHTVHDIPGIFRIRHIQRRNQPQFNHFRIAQVVEPEKIGTGLLERRGIVLQLTALHTRSQLPGTVSQTFMQVGMQIVGQLAVLVDTFTVFRTQHELLEESVAMRRLSISVGNVVDGHRLRTVLLADPIRIGQIDTDRCRRITVAAQHRCRNHLGRNPFDHLLPVGGIYRRMILEPLRILGDNLRTATGLLVHEVDQRLPRRLASQRIAVIFDKSVHEIDVGYGIPHPQDVITVEIVQVAGFVIVDEGCDGRLLRLLGNALRLLQPVNDLLNRRRIHTAYFPHPLADRSVLILHELRIQSVGDRFGIGRIGHATVELFHFGLCHAFVIVVGGSGHQILTFSLIELSLIKFGVENRLADHSPQRIELVAELLDGDRLGNREEILLRKFGYELVVGIVVMNSVGEPHFFEVFLQRFPFGRRTVTVVILINHLQRAAHGKVVFEILVEHDVAAALGGFGQVVDQLFLPERQLGKARHLVAENFNIVEAVQDPGSILRLLFMAGNHRRCG